MSTDESENKIIIEHSSTDKNKITPDVSFLDGLSRDTLELVELIMATSTGQKDIIRQLKHSATT